MDAIDFVMVLFLVWWICANARASSKEGERPGALRTLRDYFWSSIDDASARAIARDVSGYALFLALFIAADLVLGWYRGRIASNDYAIIAGYLFCTVYFCVIQRYAKERLWALPAFSAALVALGVGFLLRDYFRGVSHTGYLVVIAIFAPFVLKQFRAWLWLVRFGAYEDPKSAGGP